MNRLPEFVAWVVERLEPLGPLRTRALFGGHGLWLDEAVGEEPGARGKAAVQAKYNWGSEAAKLLDLYAQLLGEPQAQAG